MACCQAAPALSCYGIQGEVPQFYRQHWGRVWWQGWTEIERLPEPEIVSTPCRARDFLGIGMLNTF